MSQIHQNKVSPKEHKRVTDLDQPGSTIDQESATVVNGIGRRIFLRALGLVSAVAIVDQVAQGGLSDKIFGAETAREKELLQGAKVAAEVDNAAADIAKNLKEAGEKVDQIELMKKTIDYLGTGLFVQGVLQLIFVKESNHINAYQYAILTILNGLKYQLSTPTEREHLLAEHGSAIKTGLFIGGAMTIGEGVNADIAMAWERSKAKKMEKRNQIALMTTLSLGVSSIGTTLVNSTVVKAMAHDLAKTEQRNKQGEAVKDTDIMAICNGHNTNLAGIALFGNPPFMAVCEKYGFKEGIKWKFKTMLPVAIYSWYSATFKLNLVMARREGLVGAEAIRKAAQDTVVGLSRIENIKFFAATVVKSVTNAAKYFAGVTGKDFKQDLTGIEIQIGEVIANKIKQLAVTLPFAENVEHEDIGGGRVVSADLKLEGADTIAGAFIEKLCSREGEDTQVLVERLIQEREYDQLIELGKTQNIPQIEALVHILRDYHDDKTLNNSPDNQLQTNWRNALNPVKIADRVTDINRIKATAGHNLADVINVFPFQAGCIPILVPVFKEAIAKLEKHGLTGTKKEVTIFFMLQIFSMFADNYVACKIGLELLPEAPQIALLSSELGGPFTPIANMSNLGQFSMTDFPMATALAKSYWHVDSTVMALAWSQALGLLDKLNMIKPPKPLSPNHH